MSDIGRGAVDLAMMKRTSDVAAGFNVSTGFIQVLKDALSKDSGHKAMIPVIGFKFDMTNGEARKEVCIPLPMVLPLILELAQFGLQHSGTTVEEVDQ